MNSADALNSDAVHRDIGLLPTETKGTAWLASSLTAFTSQPLSNIGRKQSLLENINETWPGLVLATCIVPPIDTCHMRGREGGREKGRGDE